MTTLRELIQIAGDSGAMQADGFEDCVVGIAERAGMQPLLVYDVELIIRKIMERDKASRLEAEEFVAHNITGAWVGDGTPLFLTRPDEPEGQNEEGVQQNPLFSRVVENQTL